MRHGALFNGIGGFQLAAHWMGWENVFHCEIDKFCNQVVKQHFPESICYEDIKTTDFTRWRGKIDIISGGFPCQPYSSAGKRKGKEDDRHLWPEMLRAIREIQPGWVVGENVRGLISWNGGMVFNEVQTDLEAADYEVLPFLLPAAGVNSPQERYRIWFVAYAKGERCREERKDLGRPAEWPSWDGCQRAASGSLFYDGEEVQAKKGESGFGPEYIGLCEKGRYRGWDSWPTQHPVCAGNDGLSSKLDGITFSKWRQQSIKGVGNAIVPGLALQIFKAIEAYDRPRIDHVEKRKI